MGPGSRIGSYELVQELARGGMGAVFRARDARSGREVALKLLLGGRQARERERLRFEREARALARLRHPHVVSVLDAGQVDGLAFLAMELVPGESLARRLQRQGQLPLAQAVSIARKLAGALHHAHSQGLLHRDVKPQNVLLREDDEPVLTDFGLTREVDSAAGESLTRTIGGQFLGTPGYCAPEQARGDAALIGPRSDVYGLGALLVALLTGAPPHEPGSSLPEAVAAAERAADPPSRRRPEIDGGLDAICLRALAVDPAARFPDADALARALEAWEQAPRTVRGGTWRGFLLGLLVGAAGGSGVTGLALTRRGAEHERLVAAAPGTGQEAGVAAPGSAAPHPPGPPAVGGPAAPPPASARERAQARIDACEAAVMEHRLEAAAEEAEAAARLDPSWAHPHAMLGAIRARLGDGVGALEALGQALTLDPDDQLTLLNRANLLMLAGELPRAEADLTRALELDPRSSRAHVIRGLMGTQRGELEAALSDFERAIGLDPSNGEAYLHRAVLRLMTGREVAGARQDLDLAVQYGGGAQALANRGAIREREGDLEGAVEDLERAVAEDPRCLLAVANRGVVRDRLGDLVGALQDLDAALRLDPSYVQARINRSGVRRRLGDFAGALEDAEEALRRAPGLPRALADRAMALAGLGQEEEGLRELDRALERDPRLFMALSHRAALRERRGDLAGALRDLEAAQALDEDRQREQRRALESRLRARLEIERALEATPGDPRLLTRRAELRALARDVSGALADLDQALTTDPHLVPALVYRGALRLEREEGAAAQADFAQALELAPGHTRAWVGRASALRLRGDLAGAQRDLERAVELDPHSAEAWLNLGAVRQLRGDDAAARSDYDRAIELEPRDYRGWGGRGGLRVESEPQAAREDLRQALNLAVRTGAPLAEVQRMRQLLTRLEGR